MAVPRSRQKNSKLNYVGIVLFLTVEYRIGDTPKSSRFSFRLTITITKPTMTPRTITIAMAMIVKAIFLGLKNFGGSVSCSISTTMMVFALGSSSQM